MAPVYMERPKMTKPIWDSLKGHILREREKKKQELEADAEVERQRKERERQQRQDSMTLSETRDQIQSLESKLSELKEEKHQLFLQLKRVLNEDETRRRQLVNKDASEMMSLHPTFNSFGVGGIPITAPHPNSHPQIYIPHAPLTRGSPMYTARPAPAVQSGPHGIITGTPAQLKRSRSPSPPPQQAHNYKFGPYKPPPRQPPAPMHQNHFITSKPQPQSSSVAGIPYFHISSAPQPPHSSVTFAHQPSQLAPIYAYSGQQPARSPQNVREETKPAHIAGMFHPPPRGYVVHQQLEHAPPSQKFEDGMKYFASGLHSVSVPITPIRAPSHMGLHSGTTIQPPPISTIGGITSGYPIKSNSQPPSSNFHTRPPSPQVAYTVPNNHARLPYGHHPAQPAGPQPGHISVSRYGLHHGHPPTS